MVTYDILILSIGLALIVGMWIGVLISGEIMKETLEKNKPKKAIPHIVDVDKILIDKVGWCKGTTIYHCPNCKDFISRTYTYCHKCGQALDWSDTE